MLGYTSSPRRGSSGIFRTLVLFGPILTAPPYDQNNETGEPIVSNVILKHQFAGDRSAAQIHAAKKTGPSASGYPAASSPAFILLLACFIRVKLFLRPRVKERRG
ncbi:hypothetical protein D3C73_1256010 [compost metagenome]